MKQIIILLLALAFFSCSKTYIRLSDQRVSDLTNQKTNLEKIDLGNYTFYKREIYFYVNGDTLYKGPSKVFNNKKTIRYEIQFIAVENTAAKLRNVIHFNYIPPYILYGQYIYNHPAYDEYALITVNYINYIQFGKLTPDNELVFLRDKSISKWKLSLNGQDLTINSVEFLDRGKMKNEDTKNDLGNNPVYYKVDKPNLAFHRQAQKPVNDTNSYFLKAPILYYDTTNNDFFFEFKKNLCPSCKVNYSWIGYSHDRVRANYKKD